MDELFTSFMSKDFLTYEYSENLCCLVTDDDHPRLEYDDATWENVVKQKMTERELLENETPRSRKAKKTHIPKKSRRKLFKYRKGDRKRVNSSVVSSPSSGSACMPTSYNRKRKLASTSSPMSPKRKPSSSSSDTAKSQNTSVPKTRRCLFMLRDRKRKQGSPLALSSLKRKRSSTPLAACLRDLPSLSPSDKSLPSSDTSGLLTSVPSVSTSPSSDTSASLNSAPSGSTQPSSDTSTSLTSSLSTPLPSDTSGLLTPASSTPHTSNSSGFPSPIPCADTPPPLCSNALPPFSTLFSSTCPRELLLTCKLPPVDCSITVQQNRLVRVPDNFVYTNVVGLKERPPACVVKAAVNLLTKEKKCNDKKGKPIDLEREDKDLGVSIGELGIFSRTGLGQLEWLGEVAEMQYNVQDEKKWVMESPDNLDKQSRENIFQLLYKFPLKQLVAKEGKYSVDVRAFSNLALERYIDDSVIDTAIARLHRQCTFKESVLCLPAHTITWLDTGDGDFIHECFQEKLLDVKPEMLRLILLPVNMSDMHWGLMVLDVHSKEVFFDDGLKWNFPRISYVHRIIREVHSEFPDCDNFSSKQWRSLETFKRFGMPRQPSNGQIVGSGSCGVGVILSARDFLMSDQPVRPSWTFDKMTLLRKEIMKLLCL